MLKKQGSEEKLLLVPNLSFKVYLIFLVLDRIFGKFRSDANAEENYFTIIHVFLLNFILFDKFFSLV